MTSVFFSNFSGAAAVGSVNNVAVSGKTSGESGEGSAEAAAAEVSR